MAGAILTAAQMNTNLRDNENALRTGSIALTSQAANDLQYASSTMQWARIANGTVGQVMGANSGAPAWIGGMTLLKANSGTDTNAGATNVDTYAMASALTAKDTVLVYYSIESVTQQTAQPLLYNSTDAVTLANLYNGALAAGTKFMSQAMARQLQSAATAVVGLVAAGADSVPGNIVQSELYPTFTTAWTGAWTLALRHGGVTAGGTFKWSWALYRLTGQ